MMEEIQGLRSRIKELERGGGEDGEDDDNDESDELRADTTSPPRLSLLPINAFLCFCPLLKSDEHP